MQGLVSRKKLAKDKGERALSMVKGVLDYSEFKDVDMVIEVSWKDSSIYVQYYVATRENLVFEGYRSKIIPK